MGKAKKKVTSHSQNIDEMEASASDSDPAMAARLALNIKVLKRHDSSIDVILDHASFVVLYKHEDGKWSKTGAEGPMFLYHRTQAPHYGLFLLNRNGVDNFSASFSSADNLELTPDLIMYQMEPEIGSDGGEVEEEGETFGIWIFEGEQKDRIGKLMLELHELSIGDEPSTSTLSASPSTQQKNLRQEACANQIASQSAPRTHPQPSPGLSLLNSIFQSASTTTPTLSNASLASSSIPHQPQPAPMNGSFPPNGYPGSDSAGLKALLGLNAPSYQQQTPQPSPMLQHQFASHSPLVQHQQSQFQPQFQPQFQCPQQQQCQAQSTPFSNQNRNQHQHQQIPQAQHPNGLEVLFASARISSPSPSPSQSAAPAPTPAQVHAQSPAQPQAQAQAQVQSQAQVQIAISRPRTPTAPASFSNQANKFNNPNAARSRAQANITSFAPPTEPRALRNGSARLSPKQQKQSQPKSVSSTQSSPIANGSASGQEATTFSQTAAAVLDRALASRRKDADTTLEKREFVRETLALIHTDPQFVEGLYSRYLERMK